MSRSFKKPFHGIACSTAHCLKKAKQKMTRSFRSSSKNKDELPSGSYYKKSNHSWNWRPDDGKVYNPDSEKSYRK